ncbi:Potassium voltage-gated channel sub H member 5 [Perkinsus chesapeaki]|uniref:Potassium voltage-gated channel sub H member 5 n=1 Tax=Perkinsus chesapeaki TaxID=330153 RepID=A0A7J6LPW6_PERCH|nr:Potassium voltage-gated channel sub H member 5 [Perkinsus chesapeaki]
MAAAHRKRSNAQPSSMTIAQALTRQNSKGASLGAHGPAQHELVKCMRDITGEIAKAVLLDVQASIDELSQNLTAKLDAVLAGIVPVDGASTPSTGGRGAKVTFENNDIAKATAALLRADSLSAGHKQAATAEGIVFRKRMVKIPKVISPTPSTPVPDLPGTPQDAPQPRTEAKSPDDKTSSSSSGSSGDLSAHERARRREARRVRASLLKFTTDGKTPHGETGPTVKRRGSFDRAELREARGHKGIESDAGGGGGGGDEKASPVEEKEISTPKARVRRDSLVSLRDDSDSEDDGKAPPPDLQHGHLKDLLQRYNEEELEDKAIACARAATVAASKVSDRQNVAKKATRRHGVNLLSLSSKLNLQGIITEESVENMGITEQLREMVTSAGTAVKGFFKEPVNPLSSGRIMWDMIVAAALVYVILGIPFEAAFVAREGYYPSSQLLLDAILLVDVALQFHTQFSENGALISSRKRIARRYFKSWLWPELLTSIPWGLFIPAYSRELSAIKLGRTVSLSRLGNMSMTIMAKVEHRVQSEIWWIVLGVLKLVSALLVMCHWGACLWWLIGKLSLRDYELSWITELDMADASQIHQYVAALYFMTTTLTTVGYGDVTPETHVERVFCIFAEIVAGNVFALFSGLLCALMLTYDESGAQYRAKLKDAMRYMNKHKLESGLRIRVRNFLHQLFENQTNLESRRALVEFLRTSESLQRDVYVGLMGKMLKRYSWFRGLTHEILGKVCSVCEDIYYAPMDVMIYAKESADGMYFVVRGAIELGESPDAQSVLNTNASGGSPRSQRTDTDAGSEVDGLMRRQVTFARIASTSHLNTINHLLGAATRMYGDFYTSSGPEDQYGCWFILWTDELVRSIHLATYGDMHLLLYHIDTARFKEKMYESEDSKTLYNEKALCVAAREGLVSIIDDLVENERVDVDCVDEDGLRPLFHALSRKHAGAVAALLTAGADADSPFHLTRDDPMYEGIADAQQVANPAVRKGHCDGHNNLCPLRLAMFTKNIKIVKDVCDHTDFTSLPEREVSRILSYAAMTGADNVVDAALKGLAPDGPGSAEAREEIVNKLDEGSG